MNAQLSTFNVERSSGEISVLFLDVDGVLNFLGTKDRTPRGTVGVEASRCEILRRIVRETGCRIVVSSTWRKYPDLLKYLWLKLGDEVRSRFIGTTPVLETPSGFGSLVLAKVRGDEIQAWLDLHPEVKRFAILDDDADMAHLEPFLVRTSDFEGLSAENAAEVISRLLKTDGSGVPPLPETTDRCGAATQDTECPRPGFQQSALPEKTLNFQLSTLNAQVGTINPLRPSLP